MQPATTLTIASVGASMRGVGDVGEADVAGAVDGGGAHARHPTGSRVMPLTWGRTALACCDISHVRYRGWHDARTTRAASATSSATPASTAASPSTSWPSCSAPARARSTGSRRATRTSPWRCWPASARPSTPRSSPSAPARRTCASPARPRCRARSTSRRRRTPASPCCAPRCSTGAARRCARSPASRRSTGCSRCSRASACRPAGSTTTTTSRSSRPSELDLAHIDEDAARRTRSVIMFLGPLLHRYGGLRPALRRRLQPRHPHRRAAHVRAAPLRPRGQGHRRQLPRAPSTAPIEPQRARSC